MASPEDYLRIAAAIPLVLLGIILLYVRPRRPPQVFFALFAVAWALQIATMNLGTIMSDPALYDLGFRVGLSFMSLATLFLFHFALILRRRRHDWIILTLVILLTAGANLLLVLRPDLVVGTTTLAPDGTINARRGPLSVLFQIPFWLAFPFALIAVYIEYRVAKAGTPRRRFRGMLTALALFVSYIQINLLVRYLLREGTLTEFRSTNITTVGGLVDVANSIVWLLGGLVVLGVVTHLLWRPPPPESRDYPLVVAFILPAIMGAGEPLLALLDFEIETSGFWRILAVGVLVYTMANYQMFGLEIKAKKFIGPVLASILALFGIPILLTLAFGEFGFQAITFALVPQVVGIAGVVMFQDRVKNALFPGVDDSPDYMHQRKLDIYRVALEDALQRGGTPEDRGLKELRVRHGISQQEHSIILWMVSSEVRKQTGKTRGEFEVGKTVLDRYRLVRLLGRGTYGRTFLAYDNSMRREVALKTVSLETYDGAAAELLLREARLAATLDHPYVIDILDVAELPDRVVMVMEYADNGNLEVHLEEKGPLGLPEAVRFLRELLMALEAVHERGIVHRNLKPKNILLEADGSVRLSDFGAAAREEDLDDSAAYTTKSLQELIYQSPEQIKGETATSRSDLFVAGILFHEVLTRRHPYPIAGKDDHRIRNVVLDGRLELHTRGKGTWVDELLKKALTTDPQQRYPDAQTMRLELERLAGVPDTGAVSTKGHPEGPMGTRTT